MRKVYRPSWFIGLLGVAFMGGAVAMFMTQVATSSNAANGDRIGFTIGSLLFLLAGAAMLLYAINTKIVVETDGLLIKNMLGAVSYRIPWDLIQRVTTATDESTDSDGNVHRSTGYYLQVAGIGLVSISAYSNISGIIRDVEAHSPRLRDDSLSAHSYNPASQSALNDDMGN